MNDLFDHEAQNYGKEYSPSQTSDPRFISYIQNKKEFCFNSSKKIIASRRFKRIFDACSAILLLPIVAPVLIAVSTLIMLDDGPPILFSHCRIGLGGRRFNCLKFRTMCRDADRMLANVLAKNPAECAAWAASRKLREDRRVTRVGRFLRVTSLDELPQLFNILRGDMSFVGPRPVVADELTEHYAPSGGLSAYLSVRPGLTGLWQISGRSETSYAERVRLDIEYVKQMSFRLDLRIMLRTVGAVLARRGAY